MPRDARRPGAGSRMRVRERMQGSSGKARRASCTAALRLIQQSTDASEAAALVLAIQEFVPNGGGRPWSAPQQCCIAGADWQPWPCRSAWLVAFHRNCAVPDALEFHFGGCSSLVPATSVLVVVRTSSAPPPRRVLSLCRVAGVRVRARASSAVAASRLRHVREVPFRTLSFQSVGVAMSSMVMSMWVSWAPVRAGTRRSMMARTRLTSGSIVGP